MKQIIITIFLLFSSCLSNDKSNEQASFVSQLKGKMVFSTPYNSPGGFHLSKVGINAASDTIVIPTIYEGFGSPQWSPNGEYILYFGTSLEGAGMYLVNEEGTYNRWLESTLGPYDYASLSPSGGLILAASAANQYVRDTLWFTPLVSILSDSILFNSIWVYVKYASSRWTESDFEIFVVGTIDRNSWYLGANPDSLREIYRYNYASDSIVEQITHNRLDETGFEMSKDQHKLVFSRGTGASKVTYLMNTSDTTATPIIQGEHETVRWFGKTHYLYYVRFPNPTVYVMDTDHPEKEYELMPVYNANIDIWAQPDSAGD